MGVNLQNVNKFIYYGAPQSLDDFFQESGQGGRSGDATKSIVYWSPRDCPLFKKENILNARELDDVRMYLEITTVCRQKWLLNYFDSDCVLSVAIPVLYCDVYVMYIDGRHLEALGKSNYFSRLPMESIIWKEFGTTD